MVQMGQLLELLNGLSNMCAKNKATKDAAIQQAQAMMELHEHQAVMRGFFEGFLIAFGIMAVMALVKLAIKGLRTP